MNNQNDALLYMGPEKNLLHWEGDFFRGESAISKFCMCVARLNNDGDDQCGDIYDASSRFEEMAGIIKGANASLGNGWEEVSELCKKIDNKIQYVINDLILEMNKYIDSTVSGERDAINAVTESNEVTNELLSELNGI